MYVRTTPARHTLDTRWTKTNQWPRERDEEESRKNADEEAERRVSTSFGQGSAKEKEEKEDRERERKARNPPPYALTPSKGTRTTHGLLRTAHTLSASFFLQASRRIVRRYGERTKERVGDRFRAGSEPLSEISWNFCCRTKAYRSPSLGNEGNLPTESKLRERGKERKSLLERHQLWAVAKLLTRFLSTYFPALNSWDFHRCESVEIAGCCLLRARVNRFEINGRLTLVRQRSAVEHSVEISRG